MIFVAMVCYFLICTWNQEHINHKSYGDLFLLTREKESACMQDRHKVVLYLTRNSWCKVVRVESWDVWQRIKEMCTCGYLVCSMGEIQACNAHSILNQFVQGVDRATRRACGYVHERRSVNIRYTLNVKYFFKMSAIKSTWFFIPLQ